MSELFGCVRCGEVSEKLPRRTFRFVRQGKADIFTGTAIDPVHRHLSPIGTTQARAAASDLAASKDGKKIRMIMTSPTEGAVSTALIFANSLHVPIIKNRRLMERDMGGEFREKLDESYFERLMQHEYRPPGLSPLEEFERETACLLADCAMSPRLGKDTLFVTHVIRIMTLVKIIKGWDSKMMANWKSPDNCGMLTFGIGAGCKKCDGLMYELAA